MKQRIYFLTLLMAALAAWWVSDHLVTPWIGQISGYNLVKDRDLSVLLGHWIFGQLPRVLLCGLVWWVGYTFGLMPSLRECLTIKSPLAILKSGLIASIILISVLVIIAIAENNVLGFHPYFTKMAGDLVSNMYEEVVYRGLMFCAFYGVATGTRFSASEPLNKSGVVTGTIGSCVVFAIGHEQYNLDLRILIGVASIAFVYPWVKTRSLWGAWLAHMIVDIIGDTFIDL